MINPKNFFQLIPYLFTPPALEIALVTGADSSHYKSLKQFLTSVRKYEPTTHTVVYDLGLKSEETIELGKLFPEMDFRKFDYSKYPDYFNIRIQAGQYAWKPIILSNTLRELKYACCWMDSGNLLTCRLTWLRRILRYRGFYSPLSSGTIQGWTHPATLKHLSADDTLLEKRNLNGACVAVDFANTKAMQLIEKWRACALERECIAPPGSDRSNHRQDQAVLSVLAHQLNLANGLPTVPLDFLTHRDIDSI